MLQSIGRGKTLAPRNGGRHPTRNIARWSSLVARRAHNPKVVGSNPALATNKALIRNGRGFLPSGCHIAEARYASLGLVIALKDGLTPGANSKALASTAGAFPFVSCQLSADTCRLGSPWRFFCFCCRRARPTTTHSAQRADL